MRIFTLPQATTLMRWLRGPFVRASLAAPWPHAAVAPRQLGWCQSPARQLATTGQQQTAAEPAAAEPAAAEPAAPVPYQAPANAADRANSTSRRADIDRTRYGRTRADVAEAEL